jgi:hypothetical protein
MKSTTIVLNMFVRTFAFYWLIAAIGVLIGAERSDQLNQYFTILIGLWDIVILATFVTMIGEAFIRWCLPGFRRPINKR